MSEEQGGHSSNEEFSRMASQTAPSFSREMWDFIWQNKKWWLTPIIVALLLLAGLLVLGASGAAPFIYTIF